MVHTVVDNTYVMFSGSRRYFQIRKLGCFYSKNSQKIRKNSEKNRKMISRLSGTAFRVYYTFLKKETSYDITRKWKKM